MIVHMHIPRTGGTNFQDYMRSVFGADKVFRGPGPPETPKDVVVAASERRGFLVYSGHMAYSVDYSHLPWVTVIRNPIDRYVSHYEYAGVLSPPNLMVKMFSGGTGKLKDALSNICRFEVIGHISNLSSFAADVLSVVGVKTELRFPEAVTNPRTTEFKGEAKSIIEANLDDMILYETVISRRKVSIKSP